MAEHLGRSAFPWDSEEQFYSGADSHPQFSLLLGPPRHGRQRLLPQTYPLTCHPSLSSLQQVEELRSAAAKGGSQAGLFRQRAQKLQAQLTQHLFKADEAAKRVQQLEAAYNKPAVAGAALVSKDEPIIISTVRDLGDMQLHEQCRAEGLVPAWDAVLGVGGDDSSLCSCSQWLVRRGVCSSVAAA